MRVLFKDRTVSSLSPQVTYRVVQVTDDQLEATADGTGAASVVSSAAFAGAPQAVAQVSRNLVTPERDWSLKGAIADY